MSLKGFGNLFYPAVQIQSGLANTLNAATEEVEFIGQVVLEEGSTGGAKIISSGGGGSIGWKTLATVTFVNAGTNLRIGIQDVSATYPPQGDGTWDVQADLVGGTDTIAASSWFNTVMESGTKTITHGDLIAISLEMTTRGGADQVDILSTNTPLANALAGASYPALPSTVLNTIDVIRRVPCVMLNFDDGTKGWLFGSNVMSSWGTTTFNVNTAGSDEYANFFEVPAACRVLGVFLNAELDLLTAADYEVNIYSDAFGTPTLIDSVFIDTSNLTAGTTSPIFIAFPVHPAIRPGQDIVVSLRPTLTGNMDLSRIGVDSAGDWLPTGVVADNCYGVSRVDNSGPFVDGATPVKTTRYGIHLIIDEINLPGGNASSNIGI